MTSANFTFVMCDVCHMPSLPSAKFFAECKISPNTEFAECKISANAEFCCVSSFLSENFFWAPSFPHAEFFRVPSFSDGIRSKRAYIYLASHGLLRAEFAKSRVLSNAKLYRVTACRRLPAVKSKLYVHKLQHNAHLPRSRLFDGTHAFVSTWTWI